MMPRAVAIPACVTVLIYLLVPTLLFGIGLSKSTVDTVHLTFRVAVMLWAGARGVQIVGSLRAAAMAGVIVFAVDSVFLQGGGWLTRYIRLTRSNPYSEHELYLAAFKGTLMAFVIFLPISALIGLAGGVLARRGQVR